MSTEDERRAIRYVLGTMAEEDRGSFQAQVDGNAELGRTVEFWRVRLQPLYVLVESMGQTPEVWEAAQHALAACGLRQSRDRWRTIAVIMSALCFIFTSTTFVLAWQTLRD